MAVPTPILMPPPRWSMKPFERHLRELQHSRRINCLLHAIGNFATSPSSSSSADGETKNNYTSELEERQNNRVRHASCRIDLAGSTLDLWPLYLFHPGAVTVNFAVNILTRCQITLAGTINPSICKSIDTGREDHFRNFDEFCQAKDIQHHLAAHLVRFFLPAGTPKDRGFTIETNSESPAGAGISGSSALMMATAAARSAHFTAR